MKILHVIASLAREPGGSSQAGAGMAVVTADMGRDVRICTSDWGGIQDAGDAAYGPPVHRNGVAYRYFSMPRIAIRGLCPDTVRGVPRLIGDVGLVHLHSLYLCRRRNISCVIRPHGTLNPCTYRRKRPWKYILEQMFQDRVNRNAAIVHFSTAGEMGRAAPVVSMRPEIVAPLGGAPERSADGRPGRNARHWPGRRIRPRHRRVQLTLIDAGFALSTQDTCN